jgi:hypothetical protein
MLFLRAGNPLQVRFYKSGSGLGGKEQFRAARMLSVAWSAVAPANRT